jgi:hypothetical protein
VRLLCYRRYCGIAAGYGVPIWDRWVSPPESALPTITRNLFTVVVRNLAPCGAPSSETLRAHPMLLGVVYIFDLGRDPAGAKPAPPLPLRWRSTG